MTKIIKNLLKLELETYFISYYEFISNRICQLIVSYEDALSHIYSFLLIDPSMLMLV